MPPGPTYIGPAGGPVMARETVRILDVPAWRVAEGDLSLAGARVISVHRDVDRGHVRIGLSTGETLDLPGEHRFMVADRTHDEPARRGRVAGLFTAAARIGRRPGHQ